MTELVWKGKIVKTLPNGNFKCLFCYDMIKPYRIIVSEKLFICRDGDNVYIPKKFRMNGKLYDPIEEHTPFSHLELSDR